VKLGSLFSGVDGLALGLERAGLGHTIWQAEADPSASSVLASHWPDVPNLGDVRQVDWARVEPVDVLCAGPPCQPASSAGRRRGRADERWLWPEMARATGDLHPRVVIVENVPGLLSVNDGAGFGEVLAGLAGLGYDASWGLLGAWQVGGCHRRDRLFLVAVSGLDVPWQGSPQSAIDGGQFLRHQATLFGAETQDVWPRAGVLRGGVVQALGSSPWTVDAQPGPETMLLPTPTVADSRSTRNSTATRYQTPPPGFHAGNTLCDVAFADLFAEYAPAVAGWAATFSEEPPDPTEIGPKGARRLSANFTRWMMGFAPGWCDGLTRTSALKCFGNAVVPQVAQVIGEHVGAILGGNVARAVVA